MNSNWQHHSSVNEFLKALVETQATWQHPKKPLFIWRGVGDAEQHALVPSALRPNSMPRLEALADISEHYHALDERQKQVFLEFRIVERFLSIADKAGLSVPNLAPDVSEAFNDYGDKERQRQFEYILSNWPTSSLIPVIALAQHYGLPTRLLDWSYHCLTAAYFAAINASNLHKSAVPEPQAPKLLAVWMASAHDLREAKGKIGGMDVEVGVFSPPRYQNANMMAQSGLFTTVIGPAARELEVARQPLDQLVVALQRQKEMAPGHPGTFFAFSLPWKLADELLFKLHNLGVSPARLMPGFGGVALAMEELAGVHWQPQPPAN